MSSFFNQLFHYRPRNNRSPKEDFFTEALAGVLKASLPLRAAFVQWLIGYEVDAVHLYTQKAFETGERVDVWIEARSDSGEVRHVLALENKIDASEGPDQLRRYEAHLKHETAASTRTLVYATRHERAPFEPCRSGPPVAFKPIHWFRVANWFKDWLSAQPEGLNDRGVPLVRELLSLMEDWNMAIHLTADDLAAATRHRTSVERNLLQLLDEVYAACALPGEIGNAWAYNRRDLYYTSPFLDAAQNAYAEFGFDFERDDPSWSVPQLGLPAAYFAVLGTGTPELEALTNWDSPPEDWDGYLHVKWLNSLQVQGHSFYAGYLDFFLAARRELWQALGRE